MWNWLSFTGRRLMSLRQGQLAPASRRPKRSDHHVPSQGLNGQNIPKKGIPAWVKWLNAPIGRPEDAMPGVPV